MDSINSAINSVTASVTSALGYDTTTNETAGKEPISGEQGKGTAVEPYDKGNETTATETTTTTSSDTTSSTMPSNEVTGGSGANATSQPAVSEHTSPSTVSGSGVATSAPTITGQGPDGQSRPSAGDRPGDVRPTEANENRPNVNAGGFGTAEPSVNADPKSAQAPETEHEGAKRPLEEPDKEETKAIKEDKKEIEGDQKLEKKPSNEEERIEMAARGELPHDPNDHSGEPMKMHDGGASKDDEVAHEDKTDLEKEKARKASIGQEGGGEHGKEKGTGEQYVKSTGLKADGGDFDASKPGAGKEATRLMEEKGMHRGEEGGPTNSGGSAVAPEGTGEKKQSGISKLKEKLHIGSGKDLDESKQH